MTRYKTVVSRPARADIRDVAKYIAGFSVETSTRWTAGLKGAVDSLATMPARCGRAREAATLGGDLRQLLYGSWFGNGVRFGNGVITDFASQFS